MTDIKKAIDYTKELLDYQPNAVGPEADAINERLALILRVLETTEKAMPAVASRIEEMEKGWGAEVVRMAVVTEALRHERDALLIQIELGVREDWTAYRVREKCHEALELMRSGRRA